MGDPTLFKTHVVFGAELRYIVPSWGDNGYVSDADVIDFSSVSFAMCVQSLKHVTKQQWDKFADRPYWRLLIICADGTYHEVLYDITKTKVIQDHKGRIGIQWFMKQYSCLGLKYANSDRGIAIVGSKEELAESVLNGYDITVTTETDSGGKTTRLNNVEVSQSGEVGGQGVSQVVTQLTASNSFEIPAAVHHLFSRYKTIGEEDKSEWVFGGNESGSHTYKSAAMVWLEDSCWQHVFTNDANGHEKEGSRAFLVAAVLAGHRVKVVIGKFSMEADNVKTTNGHIVAQLLNQVSKRNSIFWVWQMVHTTGSVQTRNYDIGKNTVNSDTVEKKEIRWFVDSRPWTKVLTTHGTGVVESGSKSDLKAAIEKGAQVRVAVRRCAHLGPWVRNRNSGYRSRHQSYRSNTKHCWFIMTADNLELGPNDDVAAQLIQRVTSEQVTGEEFRFRNGASWQFLTASTEANLDIVQFDAATTTMQGHFSEKAYITWFVSN